MLYIIRPLRSQDTRFSLGNVKNAKYQSRGAFWASNRSFSRGFFIKNVASEWKMKTSQTQYPLPHAVLPPPPPRRIVALPTRGAEKWQLPKSNLQMLHLTTTGKN